MEIPKFKLLWQYQKYWAENTPEFPTIHFNGKIITAKELDETTDKLANAFIQMGLKKGDRIVTILPTNPEYIYTFLAASKIGVITVPMDINYKKADLERLIPHCDPKSIIATKRFGKNKIAKILKSLRPQFGDIHYIFTSESEFGMSLQELMKKYQMNEGKLKNFKENQTEDDNILIIWTGGTTGKPKAVLLSHKNYVVMAQLEFEVLSDALLEFGDYDHVKALVNLPVSHVGGGVELIGTSLIGGSEMFVQEQWSPLESLNAIKENNIPWMGGVPTMYKILLSLPNLESFEPKKNLNYVVIAGEKVSMDLLRDVKENICESIIDGYGATEAGAGVAFTEIGDDLTKIADGYVGKPLPKLTVKIIDEDGNELPPNKVGEVIVKGPVTSEGYFKMPKEDKVGFTTEGFCKTGDLGYLDKDEGLYITGRIKNIIRVGSYTVLPSEVEELAVDHPKVAIAAALGVADDTYGEVVWLVVGPELGQKFTDSDKEELRNKLKKNLAKYKVPKKIITYQLDPNNLPITRIGKVDRQRLRRELVK